MWPSAASWRADVWWSGHWSSKLCRRMANDMFEVGFMLVFQLAVVTDQDVYRCTILLICRRIQTLLLSLDVVALRLSSCA
jgi:hypothetical protein